MRFFFSSRQFKIILSIVLILIAISVMCVIVGSRISPQADILGTITAPFSAAATKISGSVKDFIAVYENGEAALIENDELKSEISELREKIADYEQLQSQNEFYKDYLGLKEANPDFEFKPAIVISRDKQDPYKSFVINKGSLDGIKTHNPVITKDGLVGYISETGLKTAKISTVLSADIKLGALGNRTNDSGVVSGEIELANKGLTKFFNLSRSCNVAVGDYVITSGEGIFPDGLLIGTVESIGSDKYNTSIYAEVKPFADIENLREVMVITSFEGEGGVMPSKEE